MEDREFLANHHRQVVNDFIEGVLSRLDLTDLERNVVGVAIRAETEERLVPGLTAVLALLLEADSEVLDDALPGWLEQAQAFLPAEDEFLAEMGRRLDSAEAALVGENSCSLPSESEVVREFRARIWEVAPVAKRPAQRCFCGSGE